MENLGLTNTFFKIIVSYVNEGHEYLAVLWHQPA